MIGKTIQKKSYEDDLHVESRERIGQSLSIARHRANAQQCTAMLHCALDQCFSFVHVLTVQCTYIRTGNV